MAEGKEYLRSWMKGEGMGWGVGRGGGEKWTSGEFLAERKETELRHLSESQNI